MATSLTTLVQNLNRISNGGRNDRRGGSSNEGGGQDPRYGEALQSYFAGKATLALDRVTQLLVEDPDSADRFAAYRLWIELLAEGHAHASLHELREHLFIRGQAEPEDHVTYMALRGVVHFELDEFSAARLLCEAVQGCKHDPYALELIQLVDSRGFQRGESHGEGFSNERINSWHLNDASSDANMPPLLQSTVAVTDFFHWQTLARSLLGKQNKAARQELLQHVREAFRGSPMPHLFEFHECIDSGLYAGAAMVAGRLVELFPENVDYRYFQAYAHYENGDYPKARRILQDSLYLAGDDDAEFLSLLGHCHAKMGEAEKAKTYLQRAVSLLTSAGLPSTHVRLEMNDVDEELRGEALDPVVEMPREPRHWLVTLSPRRYYELQTSSENVIDRLLRPMGKEPRPGDYCFFAYSDSGEGKTSSQWKIVAVYAVDSEPVWHPVYHYQTALRLVNRPEMAIPIDVEIGEEDMDTPASRFPKGHPFHFGVFEFGAGALDIINEAVRRHKNGEIERRVDGGKSRRPTG